MIDKHEADTVRTSIVKETAQFLARMVAQHLDPGEYDRVHTVDGIRRFRVSVSRYKGDETDRRLEKYAQKESDYLADMTSDRSSEA